MGTFSAMEISAGEAGEGPLQVRLARPAEPGPLASRALILCHGFPSGPQARPGETYGQLAERVADLVGWTVVWFNFRGAGGSRGDFSLGGWMADLRAVIDHVLGLPDISGVWLGGFNVGGALALCAAGEDERVRGVASLGAPPGFEDWAADPAGLLETARQLDLITTPGFPGDPEAWARELAELQPLNLIGKIPPRPILLVHGSDDETVPLVEARALADAAEGQVELRALQGAGHRLRHDPRAIAMLVGWVERQEDKRPEDRS